MNYEQIKKLAKEIKGVTDLLKDNLILNAVHKFTQEKGFAPDTIIIHSDYDTKGCTRIYGLHIIQSKYIELHTIVLANMSRTVIGPDDYLFE